MKYKSILALISLTATLLFTGCGAKESPAPAPVESESVEIAETDTEPDEKLELEIDGVEQPSEDGNKNGYSIEFNKDDVDPDLHAKFSDGAVEVDETMVTTVKDFCPEFNRSGKDYEMIKGITEAYLSNYYGGFFTKEDWFNFVQTGDHSYLHEEESAKDKMEMLEEMGIKFYGDGPSKEDLDKQLQEQLIKDAAIDNTKPSTPTNGNTSGSSNTQPGNNGETSNNSSSSSNNTPVSGDTGERYNKPQSGEYNSNTSQHEYTQEEIDAFRHANGLD